MWFDSKMSWSTHIKELKSECKKRLTILKTIAHKSWGADTITLKLTFKALIMAKLDYGAVIYQSAKTHWLKSLDPVINTGMRIAIGAYHTSPIYRIFHEANELNLWERRKLQTATFTIKCAEQPDKISNKTSISQEIYTKYTNIKSNVLPVAVHAKKLPNELIIGPKKITRHITPNYPPWNIKSDLADTELLETQTPSNPEDIARNRTSEKLTAYRNYNKWKIVTTQEKTRITCIISTETQEIRRLLFNIKTGIKRANIAAISNIINSLNPNEPTAIAIFTTIAQSVESICSLETDPINTELINQIQLLVSKGIHIKIVWIPHIRDQEANPTLTQMPTESIETKYLANELIKQIKQRYTAQKLKEITKIYIENQNGITISDPNANQWTTLNRREQAVLTRLRIGHTKLTHSYLIAHEPPPLCNVCNQPLTVKHIFENCSLFKNDIDSITSKGNWTTSITRGPMIKKTLDFLKKHNLFDKI